MSRTLRAVLFIVAVVAVGATGCGPTIYVSEVTRRTQRLISEAKSYGAETLAPYEFTTALEYLMKARELGGASRFQDARELAKTAQAFATKAKDLARERAKR